MDEPMKAEFNTLCPDCGGSGEIRVARAVVQLGTGQGGTASVTETCKTCHGNGSRKGFQPPV
ncbi:DnaJ-class molecular chaperone [Kribbella italica]|uniref:DnaJ-class molecular chaperone n=1 Tax=Kribbella italica TaxID=1540520 RepID=A0A7W9MRZ0_9ACTN|nr:DnaJ-class molecular chaperone [Kribbella italica]